METIKFAFRSLLKSPAFTFVAILALGLGIGANSAIFSVIDAIFLRPLPYENPSQIVQLQSTSPERAANPDGFSYPRMLAVRERQQVFTDIALSTPNAFTVTGAQDPEQLQGLIVSNNYFPLLGVRPALGRGFLPEEDRAGGAPVVLISYGYWQKHFSGRPEAVGESITIDGRSYTVIGVMPKSLSGFPLNQFSLFTTRPYEAPFLTQQQIDDGGFFYNVLARLKPGVGIEEVRSAMEVIGAGYAQANPTHVDTKSKITVRFLQESLVGDQRQTYGMLFAAVAAVLLIACANVANLLLARFSRRRKEIGIRFALGATRRRVVFQFLTESLMVSIAGGLLGLVLAALSLPLLVRLGTDFIPRANEISLDPTVSAFTLASRSWSDLPWAWFPRCTRRCMRSTTRSRIPRANRPAVPNSIASGVVS